MNKHQPVAALVLLLLALGAACRATSSDVTPTVTPAPPSVFAPLPRVPEVPPEPAPPPELVISADFLELQQAMAQAIEAYRMPGKYAVAVTDLQTGETVSVNGAEPQLSGCVMNLFVILQVARELEAGRLDYKRADSLIAATTWSSNAATARDLYALLGEGDATRGVEIVDRLIHEVLGLEVVILDHPPSYPEASIERDFNNWVTAEAMNQALVALWSDDSLLSPEWRIFVLDHLSEVKAGLNYLTAAVPEGIVSHKNGFLEADTGFVDNDAGIVRLERGGLEYAYAVTFLSEQVPTKYGDVTLGQQLSKLAYDLMVARYP